MDEFASPERTQTTVCYRHPDRPTRLRCTECDRPICVECSNDAAVGQKCPECAKPEGRYRVVDARRTTGPASGFDTSPVTYTLIAVSVGIFLLSLVSRDLWFDLIERFAAITPAIEDGEVWRALTVVFFHDRVSFFHILFNMYALYLFGPRLEREVGSPAFAGIYFASAAGGSLLSVALGPANGISIGASGAIFGLFGAWMFVAYKLRFSPAGRAMFNQLGVLLLINLALPLFIPRIDWRAHVGGLLVGAGIAWLWSVVAAGKPNAKALRTGTAALVLAVLLVALLLL